MKSLPAYSIAIFATYIMSSVASAADLNTPDDAAKKVAPSATAAAPTSANDAGLTAEQKETALIQAKTLVITNRLAKARLNANPADKAFKKWFDENKKKNGGHTNWNDPKFRVEIKAHLREHQLALVATPHPVPPALIPNTEIKVKLPETNAVADATPAGGVPVAPDAAAPATVTPVTPAPVMSVDRSHEMELEARRVELEAAYKKCTADCAAVREEADRLRTENAQIKAKAEEDARKLAAAEAEAARNRRVVRDDRGRDDRDRLDDGDDSAFDRGSRDGRGGHYVTDRNGNRRYVRNGARNDRNGDRYGRNGNGNGRYGSDPYGNGQYGNDPFSLGNPNLFGPNGMQNPYPNWVNQAGMQPCCGQGPYGQQPYGQNLFGIGQGRQLPGMYPAPGGGYAQQPISPWGAGPFAGGGYAGRPGAPMYAGGGAPMYAGGGYGLGGYGAGGGYGARLGAPSVLPLGGGGQIGGGYGLGANVGGWNTPVYNGGYNGGYNQYAQLNGGRTLPSIYPAPR
ncbi:MAG: hypothetical protein ACXVA9_00935 [Bdellovibrionales bacterium]